MKDIPVHLQHHEFLHGAFIGAAREVEDVILGRHDTYGAEPGDGWCKHIKGALGELAVAKALDRYWSGNLGDLKAADVGPYQVRATPHHKGDLRLHRRDHDGHVYVLVTGEPPHLCVRGWLYAEEGKQDRFWGDPYNTGRPAFWVPQSLLRRMEDLP